MDRSPSSVFSLPEIFEYYNNNILKAKNFIDRTKHLDKTSKKIISNSHFWEFITKCDENELLELITNIYNVYNICKNNSFSENFKPIDDTTGLEIDFNNIKLNNNTCYNLIYNIIDKTSSSSKQNKIIIATVIDNITQKIITDESLSEVGKKEKLKKLVNISISKGYISSYFSKLLLFILFTFIVRRIILPNTSELNTSAVEIPYIDMNLDPVYSSEIKTAIDNTYDMNYQKKIIHYSTNSTSVEILDTNNEMCILLVIRPNEIYVSLLYKCDNLSGTSNLNKIDDIAKYLKISKLYLNDMSKIIIQGIKIDLKLLDTLSSGLTFYNKYGYFAYNHESSQIKIKKLLNLSVLDFITHIEKEEENNCKLDSRCINFYYSLQLIQLKELLDKNPYDNLNNNMKVKDFFLSLKNNLKKENNKEHIIWSTNLLNIILHINYHINLFDYPKYDNLYTKYINYFDYEQYLYKN